MTHDDTPRKDARVPHTAPAPLDAITVAQSADDAVARLIHEVAGLVDGSLRYLSLAQRDLAERQGAPADSPSVAYLDSAADALSRLASLVHDASGAVDRYSSLAMGRRLSLGRSLRDIIEHAVAVVRPIADERSVEIELSLDPAIRDAERLPIYPVVMNALKNAIEACAAGDRVTLRAWADHADGASPTLEIEVADTGRGLTEPHDRAFEPGFSTKPGNSGLGLAISRDIVEELGGRIALSPNTGARGARLSVRLPLTGNGGAQ